MHTYVVQSPIEHDQKRYEVDAHIALSERDAATLPVTGPVDGEPEPEATPTPEPTPDPTPEPKEEGAIAKIDVNVATEVELTAINGLGPSIAAQIIALRPIDDLALLSEIPRFRDEWLDQMEV